MANFLFRSLTAVLALTGVTCCAQDIHNAQFNATPLSVNPAFTGMFNGSLRASAIYQNQWRSVTTPFISLSASVDARLITFKNNSYLGLGGQLIQERAGDGDVRNFEGTVSTAFHKLFNSDNSGHACDLAIGVQGGYTQKSYDLAALYFNGPVTPPVVPYRAGLGNALNNYIINTGVSFSQVVSPRLNYTAGISGNNLNQPNDQLLKKQNESNGLDMAFTAELGANWIITNRLTIKPAIIYITHSDNSGYLGGAEVNYNFTGHKKTAKDARSVFAGGWSKTGSAAIINAGVAFCNLRIGVAYGYRINTATSSQNGSGGFEIMARYIAHGSKKASHKLIPCDRF